MDSFSLKYQILINMIDKIELKYKSQQPFDEIKYNFVPYEIKNFLNIIVDAYEIKKNDKNPKFIDIGCGIGTKVLAASGLFESYGIDCNPELIEISKVLGCNNTLCCDIFEYNFSDFDILFYYRPFYDDVIYEKFENKIYEEAKSGAIILPTCSNFLWSEKFNIKQISNNCYQKLGSHTE